MGQGGTLDIPGAGGSYNPFQSANNQQRVSGPQVSRLTVKNDFFSHYSDKSTRATLLHI